MPKADNLVLETFLLGQWKNIKMTLGQLEARMPSPEREYGQEKTMRRERPDKVLLLSAFDDEKERLKAKGIEGQDKVELAFEGTKDP